MNAYNSVRLRGRLSFEPKFKEFDSGAHLASIGMACKASRGTLFIDVDIWDKKLIKLVETLQKGEEVEIVGELRSSSWITKDGLRRKKINVVAEDLRRPLTEKQESIDQQQESIDNQDEVITF